MKSTNAHYEANLMAANFSAFEIDDEVLANLREYALSNSLYWALAEGHACEQSARRNAMDVCCPFLCPLATLLISTRMLPRMLEI